MLLFSPIKLGPLTIKNRVIMPAMHLVYTPEGEVTDRLIDFYAERARGGVGMIIVGGCAIDEVSSMHGMVSINEDRFIPGLTRLGEAIHQGGALAAVQLYQPGRYAFSDMIGGRKAIAPSAVRSKFTGETPREMSKSDIRKVIQGFGEAARRARLAGFDAVEILGSAGYLISQFLSPITNHREDEYGGPFENRIRFGLEVAEEVRAAAGPKLAVIMRLAGHDFMPHGNNNRAAGDFAAALEKKGVDCFNITGGWHETRVPQLTMNLPRGGYVFLARGIKEKVGVPVMACNRINNPELAENILRQGRADLIGVARGLIADPQWVEKAQTGKSHLINLCIGCNQGCFDHVFTLQPVCCLVNPRAGRERELTVRPAKNPKNIMVIGGGPAGLTFAETAAVRGHKVRLFEKADHLGGQINLAAALPERAEFMTMIRGLENRAREAGVEILLGQAVDRELIDREKPDLAVVCTGGHPLPAPFPINNREKVFQAWEVLADRVDCGSRVVVIGGGAVGCEAALYVAHLGTLTPEELHFLFVNKAVSTDTLTRLANRGDREVTLVEMTGRIGSDIGQSTGWIIRQDLKRAQVNTLTQCKALEIKPEGVVVENNGHTETLAADTIILALGTEPDKSLAETLKNMQIQTMIFGDASKIGKAYDAVHAAYLAALEV